MQTEIAMNKDLNLRGKDGFRMCFIELKEIVASSGIKINQLSYGLISERIQVARSLLAFPPHSDDCRGD